MNLMTFSDFRSSSLCEAILNEVQIQFNKNRDTKFGNVVILAGGAGSGKGFTLNNLVGIEGKVFDVDALKKLAQKTTTLRKKIIAEFGVDIDDATFDLKVAENVGALHTIIGDELKLPDKQKAAFFASVLQGDPSRKPNIIFDVTLKDMKKFNEISDALDFFGYDVKKRHLVWIVNDVEVAKSQNLSRDRVVPEFILVATHKGANATMKELIEMGTKIQSKLDGDIFFTFGKKDVDNLYIAGDSKASKVMNRKKVSPGFMKEATYIQMKEVGKPTKSIDDIGILFRRKIDSYTPEDKSHEWSSGNIQ